jgi:hypothetical protein
MVACFGVSFKVFDQLEILQARVNEIIDDISSRYVFCIPNAKSYNALSGKCA